MSVEAQPIDRSYHPISIRNGDDFSDVPLVGKNTNELPMQGDRPSLMERAEIDYTKTLKPPKVALRIRGEIYGTLGNFSMVIGKAKSGKTFFMTLLMAAAIRSNLPIRGMLPATQSKVVFVDTEQGEYHVQLTANRVMRLIGESNHPNFKVYGLRKFSTEERNIIIEEIINSTTDLGLLIIDGVRDLVTSINDEEQATKLANKLLKWTEEKKIHIVTVLHQNKGDFNARGHVGSELVNKAETTVSVSREKEEILEVAVEYSRNKEFEPFAFRINDKVLPEIVDGWKPKEDKSGNQKSSPHEIINHKHTEILQHIARCIQEKPSYSDVMTQVKLSVSDNLQNIGDTKARDFLAYYINEGFIKKHGKDRSPNTYYTVELNEENDSK